MLTRATQAVLTRGSDVGKPVYITVSRLCFMCFCFSLFVDCTFSGQAQITLQVRVSVTDLV